MYRNILKEADKSPGAGSNPETWVLTLGNEKATSCSNRRCVHLKDIQRSDVCAEAERRKHQKRQDRFEPPETRQQSLSSTPKV